MISEHSTRFTGLAHAARDPQNISLVWSTVNKITDENDFSYFVPK
jgi:hypothetical protein